MTRVAGVMAGIVKALDDPLGLGRVKVSFDWMPDAPDSYWARVAAPMAGGNRGCFLMPEVNDEVLVAFDQGHDGHPYVVGYCWSTADAPPFGADIHRRGIKTVLGHELIFDDDPSSPTITLKTPEGYRLLLDERAGSVSMTLPNGNEVTLDATGLTVNVMTGSVDVNAMSATITAPMVKIDAALTQVSGVLQVDGPIITSTAVISPSYTPGVGNLI